MLQSLRRWWLSCQKPKMTIMLRQFNERMEMETRRGTHTQFMESLSRSEARAYLAAFDLWLVEKNPQPTAEDYYWRSMLVRSFFPDAKREQADLRQAVALDPGNVDIWVSLGHLAAKQEQWSQAVEYYEAGIRARPGNFFPWYGRAMVYMKLRRFDESLHDINIGIEIHPQLAYGYELRGQIYERTGELQKATADFDVAAQCRGSRPYTVRLRDELRNKINPRNSEGS